MSIFVPDKLLLTRTERAEAWVWSKRVLHALFGWVMALWPDSTEADDLDDAKGLLLCVTVAAIVVLVLKRIFPEVSR